MRKTEQIGAKGSWASCGGVAVRLPPAIALDEHGRPNLEPLTYGGLVTVNSQSKNNSHGGQFCALAHYSRFVRRGASRIDSQSTLDHLSFGSFENPNRERVLVVTNSGPGRNCHIPVEGQSVGLSLAPNSVTTLLWRSS